MQPPPAGYPQAQHHPSRSPALSPPLPGQPQRAPPQPFPPQAYSQQPAQPGAYQDAALVQGMSNVDLGGASAVSPVRAKRAARAYHAPEQAQPPPPPPPSGVGAPYPPQHQQPPYPAQPHQHQQDPRGHPQSQPPYTSQDPRDYQQPQPARAPPSFQQTHPHPQAPQQPQIPQPPHSAGARIPPKIRVKIDPDHIPSPVAVQEVDQELYRNEPFMTASRTAAPLSLTDYVGIDQGNCNPRFMRATTYSLPATDDLAVASQLPLGFVIQPFAPLRPEEDPVPIVDFETQGPPRCVRCRGYVNPWCGWIEGGQKFVCNLCGAATDVAQEYFSHLDMSQRRMDLAERPELRLGSVDFLVGREYYVQEASSSSSASTTPLTTPSAPSTPPAREPKPMSYVFAIDVSWSSGRCGLVREVVAGLKTILCPEEGDEGEEPKGLPKGSKVAVMAFDKSVMFFNLKPGLEQAQMLVVPDLNDMFLPLLEGFLVDPTESRTAIENLLDSLPALAAENATIEAGIGGPMRAALLSLKSTGGQINVFQTVLPTIGPGALKHREDTKLYGTDREKTLFVAADNFYRSTAEECVESGIGVNLFLFPTQYIDVASLGVLPGLTGGELFFHPRFEPVRDGGKLRAEIARVVQRETGYSVTMRIRCSNGLRIADHFGNFFQRNVTDLEFGTLDADKAVSARLKHEGKLDEKLDAHIQCAVLYTSASGQRRVRVHNLAVPVTTLLANVFRFADMDTTLAFIAKECIAQTASKSLRQVREQLTDLCVKALLAYRKHCASSTSPAQLILPESFKLFPLYALALMKSKALKGGPVASDVRTWSMRLIKSAGVAATVGLLYPRMVPLHTLPDDVGFPDENGKLRLPTLVRDSYVRMEPHGAYLIENGEIAIIWFGAAVSPQILSDLYAVENLQDLDPRMGSLPALPTRLSTQVRNVLTYFESQRGGRSLPVLIARQNVDGTEIEFSNMLVEDQNNEALSYPDFLCDVHAKIQSSLAEQSSESSYSSYTSFLN